MRRRAGLDEMAFTRDPVAAREHGVSDQRTDSGHGADQADAQRVVEAGAESGQDQDNDRR